MKTEEENRIENEAVEKRNVLAKKVTELQEWIGKNPNHHHRERKKKEWQNTMDELREMNAINKHRGHDEEIGIATVLRESISKEIYRRAREEYLNRKRGGEPKIISTITDADWEIIEKYKPLEKKYNTLRTKINLFSKELDEMMLSTAGQHSPEQWNNIQNFNKQILKMKREITSILNIK